MPTTIRTAALISTAVSALVLVGCRADPSDTSFSGIKSNLNPELRSLAERDADIEINLAMNDEQELRSAWNDLGRFWLTDKPSSLSPFPIMSTGGNP
ncbi:MAG: hypothetical protein ACKOYN_08415 [Planctomycetota bacterium]